MRFSEPLLFTKTPAVVLLFATLLIGCRSDQPATLSGAAVALAGSYYRGDHTGYNIYLTLRTDGRYDAKWIGYLGEYGTALGTWTVVDDRVVLSPSRETDMIEGQLRELHIVQDKGQTVLVPDLRNNYYQKYGPDEYAAFHRQDVTAHIRGR